MLAIATAGLAGCGGDGDDERSVSAFCDKVRELETMPDPLENVSGGDVEGVRSAIGEYQEALGEVAEVAPEEVSGDLAMLRDALGRFGDALAEVETPADLGQVVRQFQGELGELQAASRRLADYNSENCEQAAS